MKPTIVAILYPGCIFFEIALALELLSEKFEVIMSTPDGEDHLASNGTCIKNCVPYSKLDLKNAKAILVPGGDTRAIMKNQQIDQVLQSANTQGLWIAAICAGPLLLAKAGILQNKKIAHGFGPKQIDFLTPYFSGTQLSSEKFVCDQNILTATPDAHIDFAVELACRLECADPNKANRIKDYYRGILGRKIRALTLAIIKNSKDQFLFHKSFDKVKNEHFYRALGGGVDFGESGKVALIREIHEELGLECEVSELVASFENIFSFEGHAGHEIVMLFSATFKDKTAYDKVELDIVESGVVINKAVWRSLKQIQDEGAKLYPTGVDQVLLNLNSHS